MIHFYTFTTGNILVPEALINVTPHRYSLTLTFVVIVIVVAGVSHEEKVYEGDKMIEWSSSQKR